MSRRSNAMLTLTILGSLLATIPSASAAADDVNWVVQAGNGVGATTSLSSDFQAISVLYDGSRFPACSGSTCVSLQGMTKVVAFGIKTVVINGTPRAVLHRVLLGDDGVSPQPATASVITDSATGQDAPFVMSDRGNMFDVMTDRTQQGGPFVIYHRASPLEAYSTGELKRAVSVDGVHWTNETSLTDVDPATPLVSPARASYGPSDIILQSGAGISSTCTALPLATNYPWNCKYVLLYDAVAPSTQQVAIAGSSNGTAFRGLPFQILAPSGGAAWDNGFATMGRIRRVGSTFQMYYMGAQQPSSACIGGDSACFSLGVATSTNGLTFTKSPNNPLVASPRFDQLGGVNPSALWGVSIVDDGGAHAKLYLARRTNDKARSTYLAYTAPAPAQCPSISVASPQNGYLTTKPNPVDVYLNDTLGASVGVDLQTLSLKIDGVALAGTQFQDSIVGTYNNAPFGKRALIPAAQMPALSGGPHTFTVSVADLEGNTCSVTTNFSVDKTAPTTTITASPTGPAIAQFNGVGRFQGSSTDAGIGLLRIRANITNPIGQVKSYYSTDPSGWLVTKNSATSWDWSFVGPVLDAHFALPGEYRISVVGQDIASNSEGASAANTVTLLVV